jgi:hypothetical protein
MAYGTLAILKAYYLSNLASTTDDSALMALLTNAQAVVDALCERTFEAASNTTKYFNAAADVRGRTLWLGDEDLCSIDSITNDGTAIPSTEYVTEPRNRTPYYAVTLKANSSYLWTWTTAPEDAIVISGKWGYSESAPADIAQATYRLAAFLYHQNDAHVFDTTAMMEIGQMTIAHRIPSDVQALLAPYRRRT